MSQFDLLLAPSSCIIFLVWLMRWNHTTSHVSQILHFRSSGWRNVVGYGCVLLLLWWWLFIIVGNCFAIGLRGTTLESLSASGNSRKKLMLIDSIIILKQTQGRRRRTLIPSMKIIKKAPCIPVWDSTIPYLLLAIQRSERYWISRSPLLWILLLSIPLWRKLDSRDGGIIDRLGVTDIGGYLVERDVWRGVSGTSMDVRFSLVGGPTTVNIISVTDLYCIMSHLFFFLDMCDVWLVHNNDYCLVYQLVSVMPFMPMRLYKKHGLS